MKDTVNADVFKKICELREMQKKYFKTRSLQILTICKKLEKEFDVIINDSTINNYKDSEIYTVIHLAFFMRLNQKKYFQTFSPSDKSEAKQYEKRVDLAIDAIKKMNQPTQLNLF